MGKLNEFLNRSVFGVKYLYLVAVFVLVLAFAAWRMKPSAEEAAEETEAASSEEAVPEAESYPDTDGSGTVSSGGSSGVTVVTTTDTNDAWGRRAMEWLTSQSVPSDVARIAIQKYLAGDQLTFDEGALRDRAVRQFGYPPEIPTEGGTANKPTTPKPPAPATPKPPLTHVVKNSSDNTYTELARIYYKSSADKYIDLIQAANTSLPHSGGFKVGTRVFIPAKREPKFITAKPGMLTSVKIGAANGISAAAVKELNDTLKFPVKSGTRVRVA